MVDPLVSFAAWLFSGRSAAIRLLFSSTCNGSYRLFIIFVLSSIRAPAFCGDRMLRIMSQKNGPEARFFNE